MADETDAERLEALGNLLWDERRLIEAAEAFEVAADLREELGLDTPPTAIISNRGAARRLRVTAWATARWPGQIDDLAVHPENVRGARRARRFFSVRPRLGGVLRHQRPIYLVAIDQRGRVDLATRRETDAWLADRHHLASSLFVARPPRRRR